MKCHEGLNYAQIHLGDRNIMQVLGCGVVNSYQNIDLSLSHFLK
jgi:hypothetical protein